jgi:hypothetical protein
LCEAILQWIPLIAIQNRNRKIIEIIADPFTADQRCMAGGEPEEKLVCAAEGGLVTIAIKRWKYWNRRNMILTTNREMKRNNVCVARNVGYPSLFSRPHLVLSPPPPPPPPIERVLASTAAKWPTFSRPLVRV